MAREGVHPVMHQVEATHGSGRSLKWPIDLQRSASIDLLGFVCILKEQANFGSSLVQT
ncbi:MAG TPA: hypothetical protein V6D18_01325 [Thermosynechococcaceae cyanobacterium]